MQRIRITEREGKRRKKGAGGVHRLTQRNKRGTIAKVGKVRETGKEAWQDGGWDTGMKSEWRMEGRR